MAIKDIYKRNKGLVILTGAVLGFGLIFSAYLIFFKVRLDALEDYPEKYISEHYPNAVIKEHHSVLDERYEMVNKTPRYAIFPAQNRWGYSESDQVLAHSFFGRIRGDVSEIYSCYDPEAGMSFTERFTVCGLIPKVVAENEEDNLRRFSDYERDSAVGEALAERYDGEYFTVLCNGLIVVTCDISREDMTELRGILDEEAAKQDDDDRTEYFIADVSEKLYGKLKDFDWNNCKEREYIDDSHKGFSALWYLGHLDEFTAFKNGNKDFRFEPDVFESDRKEALKRVLTKKRSYTGYSVVIEYCSPDDLVHYSMVGESCPGKVFHSGCIDIK
jgi:hypothetical protein